MPLYKRPEDTFEDDEDEALNNAENQNEPPRQVVDEEGSWKKRYGDLRSHSQKQVNELQKVVNDLTQKVNSKQTNLPKTKEEVEAWAVKYPDVYDLLTTMIGLDLQKATSNLDERFQQVENDRHENDKERALNAIVAAHSDFFELQADTTFHEWLATKSVRTQNALYENDTDAQAAIDVLDLYKLEQKPKRGRPSNKDNAREVRVPNNRTPNVNSGEYDYTETQIENMHSAEYERDEDKIDAARREGRILMDKTGAAR